MTNLKGKKLLIIGGAFQHYKLVEAAHNLGVIAYVVDYLPVEKSPAKQIADKHYEFNITDYDAIVEMCKKEGIEGVLAAYLDACQIPYQVICERLGFPCFGTKEQYHILTDKTAFLKCCQENGVDIIPQYKEEDFYTDNTNVEYPVYVKPCDSRGSRGQSVCYEYSEMDQAIKFAKSESKSGKVVIEKYMSGRDDFCVTYLVNDGEVYLIRTGDRFCGYKEDKMDKSAILTKAPSKNLKVYLKDAHKKVVKMIKNIGIKNGPVFMQGFVDGDKVRFYDPGLRLPGAEYDEMYAEVTGVNLCEALVEFAFTGKLPENLKTNDPEARVNGHYFSNLFIPLKPGTIKSIYGVEEIKAHKNVSVMFQKYFVGDTVGEHYNVNQKFCDIAIICDSIEDTKDTINWIYKTLKILNEKGEDMKMSLFNTEIL